MFVVVGLVSEDCLTPAIRAFIIAELTGLQAHALATASNVATPKPLADYLRARASRVADAIDELRKDGAL